MASFDQLPQAADSMQTVRRRTSHRGTLPPTLHVSSAQPASQHLPEADMPACAEMMATASARLAAAAGHLDLAVQAAQQLHLQARGQGQEGPRLRTFVPALMLAAHQGAPDAAAQVCIYFNMVCACARVTAAELSQR